ncbi:MULTISPECIES: ABC transporter permease [unclassified Corynebacterium]|uniref:ABC transporter permease n=1 Tax=unclassified Corynebacterium TaxID=2624378 RepID=UPI0029CA2DCA|nr:MULTISPECIES: ABC transporter permease [unclassified Corynebacterium]WPF66002.1 ABC transporter permease [Corynebacterium sp. 22KM0430]WPF68495.1 ABC transporter permease [Corynebacterium sp. 21KM1197]
MKSTHFSRIRSLGQAEFRQFLRNRTLITMMILPMALALMINRAYPDHAATGAAVSVDYLIQFVLLFSTYYPILSIITARRDEKVLKRLRVGELTDPDILISLAVPAVFSSLAVVGLSAAALFLLGSPLPDNPAPLGIALILGIPLSWGLALLTSTITPNAEGAQITSMPIVIVIMLSPAPTRLAFPDTIAEVIGYSPFAAISDLIHLGWSESTISLIGSDDLLRTLLLLIAWVLLCCWGGIRFMKWNNDR